ncbi:MAG: D-alanine--D-alanine ligase [Lentisphaeria bacterium]
MKKNEFPYKKVHFIGAGGVGMSGLALILLENGITVSGSDESVSDYTTALQARGAVISYGHTAENVSEDVDLIVYSSAIPPDNPELQRAETLGIRCLQRGIFLAELAAFYDTVIAVAGSHGKTTTTAMLAHLLREGHLEPAFLIGGEVEGWPTNAGAGGGRILVTEVDESDGTQAFLQATHAVVVNIEDDHCWNVGGVKKLEQSFAEFGGKSTSLFAWDTAKVRQIFPDHPDARFLSQADMPAAKKVGIPGLHNRINATLAVEVACELGLERHRCYEIMADFPGVKRRFTKWFESPSSDVVIIEDYAHHPTELRAALTTLRDEYPEHRLNVIFQPHRYDRVRLYGSDFSRELEKADEVYVIPPFAAWLQKQQAVKPETIAENVEQTPATYWREDFSALADKLVQGLSSGGVGRGDENQVFAILGAGDVADLIPLLKDRVIDTLLESFRAEIAGRLPNCPADASHSWSQLTTLGIGTYKPMLFHPETEEELRELIRSAYRQQLPLFFMGAGSNTVGTDHAQFMLTIRMARGVFSRISWAEDTGRIRVGSGVKLKELITSLIDKSLIPPEAAPLALIPGTLGGAVRMNAGADGAWIGSYVQKIRGFNRQGEVWQRSGSEINWGYRQTDVPSDVCITEVELFFGAGNPRNRAAASTALTESRRNRETRQPSGRSAGSVFRNVGDVAAGRLLEKSGCKKMRIGGCQISSKHANFIIADEQATENDFTTLLRAAQWRVYQQTAVILRPEVVFANEESQKKIAGNIRPFNVCLLMGGPSAEHDISLLSGRSIARALEAGGHNVIEIVLEKAALPPLPPATDKVFPALHGTFGEDGGIQQILEERDVPYVGSRVEGSRIMMDKVMTKERLLAAGLPTPEFWEIESEDSPPPPAAKFPLVVKPVSQGSTFGITRLNKASGWWHRALKKAFAVDERVLAEVFTDGIEITVGVLHGQALPVIEIVPPGDRMFDYDAKYDHKHGHTQYLCPPVRVDRGIQEQAQRLAGEAYRLLQARQMMRLDLIVDSNGTPWILEANSIPGFTSTSLLPKAAAAAGISYPELCAMLVKHA